MKRTINEVKEKILKMKDSPTKEMILKDIEEKQKHKIIRK